ncbi:hypothetical protein D3C81_2280170 [compost metagenome]
MGDFPQQEHLGRQLRGFNPSAYQRKIGAQVFVEAFLRTPDDGLGGGLLYRALLPAGYVNRQSLIAAVDQDNG